MDVTIDGQQARPLGVYNLRFIGGTIPEAGCQVTLSKAVILALAKKEGLSFADYLHSFHAEVYVYEPFNTFVLTLRRRNHEGRIDVTTAE